MLQHYIFKCVPFCISFSFFIVICHTDIAFISNKQCQTRFPNCSLHLGTKSPYRVVANYYDDIINYPGCRPMKIMGIVRHGTRTPGEKYARKMTQLLTFTKLIFNSTSSKTSLCKEDAKRLKNWDFEMEEDEEKVLTHEGEDEMLELAERFQNRFPTLLSEEYSNKTYFFRYTATQRTMASARYFTMGLFGRRISQHVWYPQPLHKDPILRFYKLCDRWQQEVKMNLTALEEYDRFTNSPEMETVCEEVSKTFGLNFTLLYEDVRLMYMTCCFETAWKKDSVSPWCSVFSKESMKILEYAEDLKYYWRDGYGYDINYKQACPLVQNIFSQLLDPMKPDATFYFTHSGTLLKLLSHLGLYKDDFVLRHDTPSFLRESRLWKLSQVDPFGTNIMFVLFDCSGEKKLLTFHQERLVKLKGCHDENLCPLASLKEAYKESLNTCNFNKICDH